MMQLIILAVVTEEKSIIFEGKNYRLSFGTVAADKKKTSWGFSKWRIKNYGEVLNDNIQFVFFYFRKN